MAERKKPAILFYSTNETERALFSQALDNMARANRTNPTFVKECAVITGDDQAFYTARDNAENDPVLVVVGEARREGMNLANIPMVNTTYAMMRGNNAARYADTMFIQVLGNHEKVIRLEDLEDDARAEPKYGRVADPSLAPDVHDRTADRFRPVRIRDLTSLATATDPLGMAPSNLEFSQTQGEGVEPLASALAKACLITHEYMTNKGAAAAYSGGAPLSPPTAVGSTGSVRGGEAPKVERVD